MVRRQIAFVFSSTAGHYQWIFQGIVEDAQKRGSWTFLTAPETCETSAPR
jgi:hypothetical protein